MSRPTPDLVPPELGAPSPPSDGPLRGAGPGEARAPSLAEALVVGPAPAPQNAALPLLELDRVSKRFGRVVVADELCLKVGATELLGLVGPNGAGKTSLFSIISGDLAPDGGRVVFDGQVVNSLDVASRCRLGLGRTYQVPRPFEKMTVFENVLLAAQAGAGLRRRAANEHAFWALEGTGLAGEANRVAGALGLLSRKRLELARALATKPRLLLLDEVAAGLTDPEVAELIGIVRQARTGPGGETAMAVVWVEHVVRALVEMAERLVCLDGGAIIADGKPGEVLADPTVKQVYLGTEEELSGE
ncbi:MAG TPA: ATP-binding cassette domain-containing protein [Acidimicrobiales bacterium]|nr:ATP-binding cassette domain-containing protein [Acidimicrobiales bacterium]